MGKATVGAVADDRHAAATLQVDGRHRVADEVGADGEHADGGAGPLADADKAHVGAARAAQGLDRVAYDSALANRPLARIEQDVGRGLGLLVKVVLDVVAVDLQIADLAADDLDAALLAIADVVADDVDLVQVKPVEEHADAAVVVDVGIDDEHIAVPAEQVDAVPAAADEHTSERRLHSAVEADAVSFGMPAEDFEVLYNRHAFLLPDGLGEAGGQGALAV